MQTCISEKGRKSADGTEKIEQSRKITFFFFLLENKCKQMTVKTPIHS